MDNNSISPFNSLSTRKFVEYDKPSQKLKINVTSTLNFGPHSVKPLSNQLTLTIGEIAVKQGFSGLFRYAFSSKWTKITQIIDQKSQTFYLTKDDFSNMRTRINEIQNRTLFTGNVASSINGDQKLTDLDQEIKILRRLQFKIDHPSTQYSKKNISQKHEDYISYGEKAAKIELLKMNKQWILEENTKNIPQTTIDKVTKEVFGSACTLTEALNKLDKNSAAKTLQILHQKIQQFETLSSQEEPDFPKTFSKNKKQIAFGNVQITKSTPTMTLERIGVYLNQNINTGGKDINWDKFDQNKSDFYKIVVDTVVNEMSQKMSPPFAQEFIKACKTPEQMNNIDWNSLGKNNISFLDDLKNQFNELQNHYLVKSQINQNQVSNIKKDSKEIAGEDLSSFERTVNKLLANFQRIERIRPE